MVVNKERWIAEGCRRQVVAALETAKSFSPQTGPAAAELGRALVCLEEAKGHFDCLVRHFAHSRRKPKTQLEEPSEQPGRLA